MTQMVGAPGDGGSSGCGKTEKPVTFQLAFRPVDLAAISPHKPVKIPYRVARIMFATTPLTFQRY